ncbi:heterokaryon incompatibility protein-domain-containing protein [Immersiella caudata]|uniref:Heterokaryon incompatibility protein-domain-containing protein n=1 Tax=Immersiella caudata TaxID=314043 RepID=A0AA39X212_9PEZI|nr:heterokaryon incompatibility protein-domain-containing protein [Immersiella caudata]
MTLCSVCKELPCEKRRWGAMIDQRDRDGFEWTIMRYNLPGNFGGLEKRAREGCEGCWFFYDTLRDHVYRRWHEPTPWTVPIDPEQKVHLESRTGSVTHYELGIENESRRCRLDLRKATDLKSQHDFSPQVPTNPSDDACWGTALGWLKTCSTEHTSCIASAVAPILPKRIIALAPDNEPIAARLILPAPNTTARFVALSHCWGSQDNPMTKLTLNNQTEWQQQHDGIDIQSLPRNFRDAITITRRLGIRYLWIDALCILQDSTADWAAQVPKMADIFGTATLVLSATSAKHCDEGILQPRFSTCSPLLGPSKSWFLTRPKPSFTAGTLESEINAGHLISRGWAFQERMVAQRLLHYTTAGMIWECSTHVCSELPWVKSEQNKRSISILVAASRRNRQDDGSDPTPTPKTTSSRVWPKFLLPYRLARKKKKKMADTEVDAGVFIKEWINCITLYSSRDLTFPSDKLAAVAGLAATFQASLPPAGEYLAGTWSRYMATCLGWAKQVSYHQNKLPSLSDKVFRAPSWSWAAGDGRIFWPQEEDPSSRRSSRSSACDSTLDARLVDHHMIRLDGDGPGHLIGANEGSYIILEANCLHPSDLSNNAAVQCSYEPDWSEYATGNPLPEQNPLFDNGEFKFIQLRSRLVDNKNRKESYFEFWGLHLHKTSGPDSDFRRTGLLTCKILCQVAKFQGAKAIAAAAEEYKSLPWKRERVKII